MKPAKILYVLLLDRARLSQKNEGWVDERGRAFIFFPIKDLAETMHKSEMSVKTALAVLEKTDLFSASVRDRDCQTKSM